MAKICRFLVDILFIELHHRSPQQSLDTESVLGNRVKHSNRNRKNVCSKSPRQGKQSNQKGNQKREQEKQEGRQDGRQEGNEEGSEGSDERNEGRHFQGEGRQGLNSTDTLSPVNPGIRPKELVVNIMGHLNLPSMSK